MQWLLRVANNMKIVLCLIALLTLSGCLHMMMVGSALSTGQHIKTSGKIEQLEKRLNKLETKEDNMMFGVKWKPYCLSVDPRCSND